MVYLLKIIISRSNTCSISQSGHFPKQTGCQIDKSMLEKRLKRYKTGNMMMRKKLPQPLLNFAQFSQSFADFNKSVERLI
jgi:hypothetical protein